MKKMLALTMGSYIGGTEIVTLQVLQILKTKFQIHCMVNGWNDGVFISELNKIKVGYTTHKLGWFHLRKVFWTIDSLFNLPKAVLIFVMHIVRNNYDLYYTTSYRPLTLLSPFIKKRVIYHVHDLNSQSKVSRFFIRKNDKKIIRYIAVSKCIKDDLTSIGVDANKIVIAHNGVDTSLSVYKIERNTINIGIVGQIAPHKGHELLFEAFKKLYGFNNNIRLIVRGNLTESIFKKELIEYQEMNDLCGVVHWKPFSSNLTEIYSEIDILCMPSKVSESFGLVACEAGAFGIPVIASNSGGLKEIIRNNETGFLVTPNDLDQFIEKIKTLTECETIRREMGYRAKKFITLNFSKQRFSTSILNLFSELYE